MHYHLTQQQRIELSLMLRLGHTQRDTGEEIGRYLTIFGRLNGEADKGQAVIGTMRPRRYLGSAPTLTLNNGTDVNASYSTPWESADAALFMQLADQLLPSIS